MSTDAKRVAGLALELAPPPDRLKRKRPPMEEGAEAEGDDEEEDSSDRAGILAMEDFEAATSPKEKFAALKRAVQACNGYE